MGPCSSLLSKRPPPVLRRPPPVAAGASLSTPGGRGKGIAYNDDLRKQGRGASARSPEAPDAKSLLWRRDFEGDGHLGYISKVSGGVCSMPMCDGEAVFVRWTGKRWWGLCLDHTYQRMKKPPP